MVRITEQLVRKRAEHNELEISTLEEVSLHQQDIERIEHIDKWCRELKILYLQSNLIPKIENVSRLKKLEYLNLALNNIEKVENLENCESLRKLDLTVNFVGEITSIETLKDLVHFRELFLTGNPCTQFEGYKEYVIAALPQLRWLDGTEIDKSERIQALQAYPETRRKIVQQEKQYMKKREKEKQEAKQKEEKQKKPGFDGRWYTDINNATEDKPEDVQEEEKLEKKNEDDYWNEKTAHTPESRIEVHKHMEETRKRDETKRNGPDPPKRERRLQTEDGRILNVNEPKVDFELTEDDDNLMLDVGIFRHMDTSLIDVDVQTTYIKIIMKGKVLQLTLPREVKPDSSSAKRSTVTGHLLITMPKVNPTPSIYAPPKQMKKQSDKVKPGKENKPSENSNKEKLEVDPDIKKTVDIAGIIEENQKLKEPLDNKHLQRNIPERANSADFIDDPDVPPLM